MSPDFSQLCVGDCAHWKRVIFSDDCDFLLVCLFVVSTVVLVLDIRLMKELFDCKHREPVWSKLENAGLSVGYLSAPAFLPVSLLSSIVSALVFLLYFCSHLPDQGLLLGWL